MKQIFFDEQYRKVEVEVDEAFAAPRPEDILLAARVLLNEKQRHSRTISAAVRKRGRMPNKKEWLIFQRKTGVS